MLTRYDAERAPDPARWLALSEDERIELARRYHRRERIYLPNEPVHAVIHSVVETQVAMGDEIPVAAKLDQLMAEGLWRHDAVHAIGCVLAAHLNDLMRMEGEPDHDTNEDYYRELAGLTAANWFEKYGSADEDD